MKKILAFLLPLILVAAPCLAAGPVRFVLLTTSDLQSRVGPHEDQLAGKTVFLGGLPRIAALAKSLRAQADASLFLSSGDDLMGSFYSMFGGEPELRGMTLSGYDAVAPGNHEFDFGAAFYGRALSHAGFKVLCANCVFKDPALSARIEPFMTGQAAGIKFGLFGLMTPDLFRLSNPGEGVDLSADPFETAAQTVKKLHDSGASLIIALSHMGLAMDRDLCRKVPGIHVVVSGHDHAFAHETVNKTLIVQDGSGASHLGVLSFSFDGVDVQNPKWETLPIDDRVTPNPKVKALVDDFTARYETNLSRPLGESKTALDSTRTQIRSAETALGNLVADSWLWWFPKAQAALVNGGAIRGDTLMKPDPITLKTVEELLPFHNEVIWVEMTGKRLLETLEVSASAMASREGEEPGRPKSGGFFQIGGLKVVLDPSQEPFRGEYKGKDLIRVLSPGNRVKKAEIMEAGRFTPISPEKTYQVLVNSWTASGGDGHYVFLLPDVKKTPTTVITTDILSAYVSKHSPISPKLDGRIRRAGP